MENKIKKLMDYQKFEQNPKLAKIINDAHKSARELDDDELWMVNAAGTTDLPKDVAATEIFKTEQEKK